MIRTLTLLHPLDEFYARAGWPLPEVRPVSWEEVPEPYRRLLVHSHDMTPTLEAYHGERIHLRVLARYEEGDALWRHVILTLDQTLRPVEFGAIVIHLQHFPRAAREEVRQGRRPLGSILHGYQMEHRSSPLMFLRVTSDRVMEEALELTIPQPLYGRCNVIRDARGNELAEIVEILPPDDEETPP